MRSVWSGRYRRGLASTARRLVAAGWPIVPGSWWSRADGRHRCDLPSCITTSLHPAPIGCHEGAVCAPAWADLTRYALANVDEVVTRWAHRPYSVLLVTGTKVDVIDAPPRIADVLLHHLNMTGRPVLAARVAGRVLLLLASGPRIDPDRTADWTRAGVLFHQRGSWVVLPPSDIDGAQTRWLHESRRPDSIPPPAPDPVLALLDQTCSPPPPEARGVVCMTPHLSPLRHPQIKR